MNSRSSHNHPVQGLPHLAVLSLVLVLLAPSAAHAGLQAHAGPYRISLTTDPAVIPVGRAFIEVTVTDAEGKPVTGARVQILARMPTMSMGERTETALPLPGRAGAYRAPAAFPMDGAYEATVHVKGPAGESQAVVPLHTGQDTGGGGGFAWWPALAVVVAAALVALVLVRMRRANQSVPWRTLFTRPVMGSLLLIAVMLVVAVYAVRHLRRPGAMTPIEGQAMEMNMPAPVGSIPVELVAVRRGDLATTVRYSGQAVGFVEQDIYPRVQGTILSMPVYVGDHVRRGQLLASLDTSQLAPQLAEKRSAALMAEQQVTVAEAEVQQAREQLGQAHTEVGMQMGEASSARSNVTAARSQVDDARAGVESARENRDYWRAQLARSQAMLAQKALSPEEFQRDRSSAAEAEARFRQAQARLEQARAGVQAAQGMLLKAQAAVQSHHQHVAAMRAGVNAALAKAAATRSAAAQARAAAGAAEAQLGYAQIRSQVDGVVTQRLISPGVLVSPGQALLRVAQTRPIRLQANVATADLAHLEKGALVQVWGQDESKAPVKARVTSLQPALDPTAHTATAEAVYPNGDERFLPGSYVVMQITTRRLHNSLLVPSRAIQQRSAWAGEGGSAPMRSFVWVARPADPDGLFKATAVEVRPEGSDATTTAVQGSLEVGDRVVTAGHAYIKEGDTLTPQAVPTATPTASPSGERAHGGGGRAGPSGPSVSSAPSPVSASPGVAARIVPVEITEKGYEPASVTAVKGQPIRLVFTRRTDRTCGTEVLMADFGIRAGLPLNKPVSVDLMPDKSGEFAFTCGMRMLKGKVIVP